MKEIAKVRKYQKIIQSNAKIKKIQFEQLTKYLIEK